MAAAQGPTQGPVALGAEGVGVGEGEGEGVAEGPLRKWGACSWPPPPPCLPRRPGAR